MTEEWTPPEYDITDSGYHPPPRVREADCINPKWESEYDPTCPCKNCKHALASLGPWGA